jgi:surface antigen bspA-like
MIFLFSELLIGKVNRFSANTIEEYNFISKEEYQKNIIPKDYSHSDNIFKDDSVIVTLTEKATKQFLTYEPSDFSEIGCLSVEDLTKSTINSEKQESFSKKTSDGMMTDTTKFRRILQLELSEKSAENVLKSIEILEKREDILYAGPNFIYSVSAIPNDKYYENKNMWGLSGTNGINASTAWDISTGSSMVIVGVMDTGIQANHPDLINNICIENLHRDFTVFPTAEVMYSDLVDPNGHGTHVAGIIGAQGNNGEGVTGVAWNICLVSLRVFNENGKGSSASVARAINYASSKNIPILNYSGGTYDCDINIQMALEGYNGLFVTSAGNGGDDTIGDDNDVTQYYPSDYSHNYSFSDRVISVGSIDSEGKRSKFSNYSSSGNSVDIYAPGEDILSTFPLPLCPTGCNGVFHNWSSSHYARGYHIMSGTSMAAPYVTGVAALILSTNSSLTATQIKRAIIEGSDSITINIPNQSGNGNIEQEVRKLNANNSIRCIAFKVNDRGNEIIGTWFTPSGHIIIPNRINDITIQSIGQNAFKGCENLNSITIPNSVTSIGSRAFLDCNHLTSITLPFLGGEENNENINYFGYIFGATTRSENGAYVPSSLKEVILTGGTNIGASAFQNCNSIESIVLPNTITSIGTSAFENCNSLTSVTLSDTLTTMGDSIFKRCSSIESIILPNTITSIGTSAFENCSNLTTITLPNTLGTISSSMFKGCTSIESIVLPNTITSIGISAFENCSNLQSINLSNQLIEIGNAAFKACINLKNITIPSSVEQIGAYAFSNCTKLENVIVLKETSEITHLYQDAFIGCSALQSIIVPMNRVAEYKNEDHWSNYITRINPSTTQFDTYHINCLSNLTTTTILESAYNKLYRIQVECGKSYTITSNASFAIQMSLYDGNMALMNDSQTMTNDNCGTIVGYLSPGVYYLSISFKNNTSSGEINTQYVATWANTGWSVTYNKTNDISDHLHQITDNQYKNQLYYINNKGAGFYEFTLIGLKQDGTSISYPEGAIEIYNNEERLNPTEKYNLTTHSNQASTKEGQNKITVYLPQNGYYYINIYLDTDQIATLQFNIQAVETQTINLFELSDTENETISIFETNNIKTDNIKKLTIQQSGKFTITFAYEGTQAEDILCIISQQTYNSSNYEYAIETKATEVINKENKTQTITISLDKGTYYVGYFNKNDTKQISTDFTRIITQYGSNALVPDPDDQTPYGSQIAIAEQETNLYNRSYRGTNILEGFTRLIYLDDDYAPSVSRLDYDFYTSNENVATVSAYGTVHALSVTKDTNVKIMAVYKKDRSIVFTKTFTIQDDKKIYDFDPIDITINMTIKDEVITSINFKDTIVPDQMLQHYLWTSKDTTKVTVDSYGRLYANPQAIGQTIEIEGEYIYNERVKIKIKVTVID